MKPLEGAVRPHLGLLLLCCSVGCSATSPRESFAEELVSPTPPSRGFGTIAEEILGGQETIEAMRDLVEARGGDLLAVLHLAQGVHPFMVLAFVATDEETEVLATSVYWGKVQEKWVAHLKTEEAREFLARGLGAFDCSSELAAEPLFGAALIHWLDGSQVTCAAGWFLEEGSELGERDRAILHAASVELCDGLPGCSQAEIWPRRAEAT